MQGQQVVTGGKHRGGGAIQGLKKGEKRVRGGGRGGREELGWLVLVLLALLGRERLVLVLVLEKELLLLLL